MAITDQRATPLRGADDFPIVGRATYLNACSQGALSHRVRAAYLEYLDGWDANGAEWEHWVERAEAARAGFARLLHASPDEIAVTTSVSQGVNALVSALPLGRGGRDRIVISEYEFPTVGQIAHAQELRGAEVVHVRPDADGSIPLERWAEAIDERTALVCCATISYRTGHRADVPAIAALAHAKGALVLADSYQAAGAIELDTRTLGADFITGGTVKYLLASAGLGFLWVRGRCSASCPAADRLVRGRGHLPHGHLGLQPARRPHAASTPARRRCRTSTRAWQASRWSRRSACRRSSSTSAVLNTQLIEGLHELGATVVTPDDPARRGPLVCVRSTDAAALVDALAEEQIICSLRESNLRVAAHLYNAQADIDTLLASLARKRELLA